MFLHGFPVFGSARQGCVTNPNQGYGVDKVMSSISSMLSPPQQEQGIADDTGMQGGASSNLDPEWMGKRAQECKISTLKNNNNKK